MILFGEESVAHLKEVSTKIWRAPVDLKGSWFYLVDVVGRYEDFQVLQVNLFFF
jgi:hypothetical protein